MFYETGTGSEFRPHKASLAREFYRKLSFGSAIVVVLSRIVNIHTGWAVFG